jgi:hypothetical protein
LLLIFLFIFPFFLASSDIIKVELITQFYLDQSREFLGTPKDIAVDDNENVFVSDCAMQNIKIYNNEGLLLRSFGRKGGGPGEFLQPYTIDYNNNKLCVQDVGLYKYVLFNNNFEEITRFFYLVDGYNFVLRDNRIISNDYFKDKKRDFRGVILDFSGKVIKPLMPITFGENDGWNRITNSRAFVDVSKDGKIYFVKEREVKFFKFDKNGEFLKNFGKNPSYFIPCQQNKDFERAVYTSDPRRGNSWERWRHSFTWVAGIFVLEDFLGVVIRKFDNEKNFWKCFFQFYDFEGNLFNQDIELKEPGTPSDNGFFIDSNHKDRIYILEVFEEHEPQFKFYKYIVHRE